MANLGSGSGSGYPSVIDTQSPPESSTTLARDDVPNDLAAAIIATQTELGTDPAGSEINVKSFMQKEHGVDGTHGDITATKIVMEGTISQLLGISIVSATSLDVSGDGNIFGVTGTVNVEAITSKGLGTVIILKSVNGFTLVTDSDNLDLVTDTTVIAGATVSLYEYSIGKWRLVSVSTGISVGTVLSFAGPVAPSGYLLCDGATLDSVADPTLVNLFDVIGTLYGGTGASDFNVPAMIDLFTAGSGSLYALGEKGGSLNTGNHTLSIAEIASHTHTYDKSGPNVLVNIGSNESRPVNATATETSSVGGSGSHNHTVLPPFIGLTWIIKL